MVKALCERLLELEEQQQRSHTEPADAEDSEMPTLH